MAEIHVPELPDEWSSRPVPLDGRFEMARISPTASAILVLIAALVLFQLVVAPIAIVVLLLASGVPATSLLDALLSVATEHTRLMLVANTVGQIGALALPVLLLSRLHSSRVGGFLRLGFPDPGLFAMTIAGLIFLFPVVQWLGELNAMLPFPESVREFERMMMEPIERLLSDRGAIAFNLTMIAVTPAICEELLFRGYVQRQFERGLGVTWAIALTGVVFGLYHIQLTKVLPLAVLGVYMAYITWRTGSLWPAILVHFLNNATAVVIGVLAATSREPALQDIENVSVPWYIVVTGGLLFVMTVLLVQYRAVRLLTETAANERGW
jgi:membrane protease YdiL (CAAX protease family)